MQNGNESIFFSAIRTFCVALFGVVGVAVALFLIILGLSIFGKNNLTGTYEYALIADHRGNRDQLASRQPAVLWLDLQGEIGVRQITSDDIADLLTESREGVLADNRVKAIFLHINSPGGAATDSENIYHLLMAYKQRYHIPIYAYVDGMCASGGMMIACAADKIYATSSSLVGSVGVIANFFNVTELFNKIGVQSLVLTEGKGKGDLWPFRPWKPDEGKAISEIMEQLYDNFVSIVSNARPQITKEQLMNTYGASVYTAKSALELGYIDGITDTYFAALQDLIKEAGISDSYQVIELEPKEWMKGLFKAESPLFSGKVKHEADIPGFPSELVNKFLYLYQP